MASTCTLVKANKKPIMYTIYYNTYHIIILFKYVFTYLLSFTPLIYCYPISLSTSRNPTILQHFCVSLSINFWTEGTPENPHICLMPLSARCAVRISLNYVKEIWHHTLSDSFLLGTNADRNTNQSHLLQSLWLESPI